ncbi:NAD-dependent epimerase/dehydratase family protein [Streptomyces sp. NBC_01304]|uniref:NAD-dependent epimerase/dehydratase family protein n=1 Tax=Streptomyces sp. NBC_01304 TaxID=2903818 RepID=UPI002E0EC565|nr:NAD-dependent epimerase/dehydratase family protein [Streptomyces sp. NBC_01304]
MNKALSKALNKAQNEAQNKALNIGVIGGSRYFGKRLVGQLQAAGHRLTVINRGSTTPPPGVEHLVVDRDDEAALTEALGDRTFDVVIDQVCYTPVQAAIAARAFAGRTGRYVMTSTIEVYDPATTDRLDATEGEPLRETTVDPAAWPIDLALPWHDAAYLEAHYAEGKRQAEAVFTQHGGLPFVSVRSAHVLGGGAEEFTGRLDHYAGRVLRGETIDVHRGAASPTVFIHHREIADLLAWAALGDFTGPVNAASHGLLDVRDFSAVVAARTGREPVYREVAADASPFSFDRFYAMSNARAEQLGFRFTRTADWLPGAVDETLAAHEALTAAFA